MMTPNLADRESWRISNQEVRSRAHEDESDKVDEQLFGGVLVSEPG